MMKQKAKRILALFAAAVALCVAVFFGARYGWRLAGFSFCRTARIESVSVETDCVKISNRRITFKFSFGKKRKGL